MNSQTTAPVRLCIPCTMLTALVAMMIVVLCDLRLEDDEGIYTRVFASERFGCTVHITLVVNERVQFAITRVPLPVEDTLAAHERLHG